MALVGGSAGGHLVQLAAATPDSGDPYLEGLENPGHSTDLRCAVSVYGVSDLRTIVEDRLLCGMPRDHADDDGAERRLMRSSFPAVEGTDAARAWAAGQPVDYQQGLVGRGPLRPVHFVHRTGDGVVPWIQSERSHRALVAAGVDAGLDLVEGAGHGDPAVYRDDAVRRHVFSWLARHLG